MALHGDERRWVELERVKAWWDEYQLSGQRDGIRAAIVQAMRIKDRVQRRATLVALNERFGQVHWDWQRAAARLAAVERRLGKR